jgi:L-threonylcarbamoyladenylate synthase
LGGLRDRISTLIALHPKERIGLMLPDGTQLEAPPGGMVFQLGDWANPEQMAHLLYSGLRTLDAARCTLIVCPVPTDEGIGVAIRDRLRKASRQG